MLGTKEQLKIEKGVNMNLRHSKTLARKKAGGYKEKSENSRSKKDQTLKLLLIWSLWG